MSQRHGKQSKQTPTVYHQQCFSLNIFRLSLTRLRLPQLATFYFSFQDSTGRECAVILLDSERIDAVMREGLDDNQILTLTVFLASVLIHNSAGVLNRHALNELEYPLTSTSYFLGVGR